MVILNANVISEPAVLDRRERVSYFDGLQLADVKDRHIEHVLVASLERNTMRLGVNKVKLLGFALLSKEPQLDWCICARTKTITCLDKDAVSDLFA